MLQLTEKQKGRWRAAAFHSPSESFSPRAPERDAPEVAGVPMLLLGGRFRRLVCFRRLLDAVLAVEAFHPARRIDQPLLASVERMTVRAHLDVKLARRSSESRRYFRMRTSLRSDGIRDGLQLSSESLRIASQDTIPKISTQFAPSMARWSRVIAIVLGIFAFGQIPSQVREGFSPFRSTQRFRADPGTRCTRAAPG